MGNLGFQELLIIGIVILVMFGGRKIPEFMRGLGKGMMEIALILSNCSAKDLVKVAGICCTSRMGTGSLAEILGKTTERAFGPPVETPMRTKSGNGGGWRRLIGAAAVGVLGSGAACTAEADALRRRANVATLRISALRASIPDSNEEPEGLGMKSIAP